MKDINRIEKRILYLLREIARDNPASTAEISALVGRLIQHVKTKEEDKVCL